MKEKMKQDAEEKNTPKNTERKGTEENFGLRQTMRWRLTLFVFCVINASGILTVLIYTFVRLLFGRVPFIAIIIANPQFLVIVLFITCAIIGIPLSTFLGKYYLRPTKNLIQAVEEVKKGNFSVSVPMDVNPDSEIGRLIQNFNEMVRELGSIELFRNDFINNFSHEFKTPIVSIRGFARELQMGDLSDDQRIEYAKIIAEESDRLANLSGRILELSKLENQTILSDKSRFSLDEQLRQCILLLESSWTKKQVEMIPELDPVSFYSNEDLFFQVWRNLIANAIKFTPEGGTVRVRLFTLENSVIVQVSDTGMGMTKEEQSRIFEKFYQGDRSHAKDGYGIGLAIVKKVVNLCNGTVEVESEPQKGSTFTVRLPIVE